jgi:CubicO group peptidase (beta-lactamase class C family)
MAKSVTGALIGILVKEGKLTVNQPASFPEWGNPPGKKNGILIKHLLQQTSGLDFEENYTRSCDVTKMLFQKGNMAGYVLARPLVHQPGTVFNYSSGNSNLLALIIRKTVGEKNYHSFPYDSLFYPAGMFHTVLEPDVTGTFVGSSYIYATTRDYARFGLLYLNGGRINGIQILPVDWVTQSVLPFPADKYKQYGYQFWLNGKDEKKPTQKIYPSGPGDLYFADGVAGQRILIIPSKKTVIVRMGFVKENVDLLVKEVLGCIPKQ